MPLRTSFRCGDLSAGFTRLQCPNPECGHERLLAFTCTPLDLQSAPATVTHPQQPNRTLRPLWRDLILRVWGEDPLLCPKCQTTMKIVDKVLRPEEIEFFFLKLYNLWEGLLAMPFRHQWWKPEASDPAQFELQAPHWSPDCEFQDWQHASDSVQNTKSWQATERLIDAERTLVLDADPPAQDEFPEFVYD